MNLELPEEVVEASLRRGPGRRASPRAETVEAGRVLGTIRTPAANGPGVRSIILPEDHDLAGLAGVEGLVGLFCVGEREGVGDGRLGVQTFALQMLEEISHLVDTADPRAVERELFVQQQRTRLERDRATLSKVDYPPPLAGRLQAQLPSRRAARTVHADLRAAALGEISYLLHRVLAAHQDVRGTSAFSQLQALGDEVDPYYLGPARGGQHDRSQPDGSEAHDEDRIAARNARPQDPLVRGPEPTSHEGAVGVGEPVGQVEQGTCL